MRESTPSRPTLPEEKTPLLPEEKDALVQITRFVREAHVWMEDFREEVTEGLSYLRDKVNEHEEAVQLQAAREKSYQELKVSPLSLIELRYAVIELTKRVAAIEEAIKAKKADRVLIQVAYITGGLALLGQLVSVLWPHKGGP